MSIKKHIIRDGGAVLLAGLLIAATPALATSPGPGNPLSAVGASVSMPPNKSDATYLRNIWFASNSFGSGHAWMEIKQDGSSTSHFSFTTLSGKSIEETVTPRLIKIVSAAGSYEIEKLNNGHTIQRVFVRAGVCESEPSNIAAATGVTASIELDGHGNPVDGLEAGGFSTAHKAFACRSAAALAGLHVFMAQAGMSLTAAPPSRSISQPGGVHTMTSCAQATAGLLLAEAGLAAALAAEVGSAGISSPATLAAWAAVVWAAQEYHDACG